MPTAITTVALGLMMQVGQPAPQETPNYPALPNAYNQYGFEGQFEQRHPFDTQQNWVHGYFQEIPAYGGHAFYRPYNYKDVMSQSQTAAGWGASPTLPYSQQFWHRYHDEATMLKLSRQSSATQMPALAATPAVPMPAPAMTQTIVQPYPGQFPASPQSSQLQSGFPVNYPAQPYGSPQFTPAATPSANLVVPTSGLILPQQQQIIVPGPAFVPSSQPINYVPAPAVAPTVGPTLPTFP